MFILLNQTSAPMTCRCWWSAMEAWRSGKKQPVAILLHGNREFLLPRWDQSIFLNSVSQAWSYSTIDRYMSPGLALAVILNYFHNGQISFHMRNAATERKSVPPPLEKKTKKKNSVFHSLHFPNQCYAVSFSVASLDYRIWFPRYKKKPFLYFWNKTLSISTALFSNKSSFTKYFWHLGPNR